MSVIAFLVLWTVLMVATWNEENTWKHWCLLLIAAASILVLRVAEFHEGYDSGFDDGTCFVYTALDAKEGVNIKIPERC